MVAPNIGEPDEELLDLLSRGISDYTIASTPGIAERLQRFRVPRGYIFWRDNATNTITCTPSNSPEAHEAKATCLSPRS